MSQLQRHNALILDTNTPDFINEEGVKWWGLDIGDPQDGVAVRIDLPDGTATYGVLKDIGVVYTTKNLEQLMYKFTEYELIRTKK